MVSSIIFDKLQVKGKTSNSTTIMLTTVGVVFLLTTTPKAIYYFGLGYGLLPETTNKDWARIYLAYIITTLLVFLNSALNFILYCLTGTKFRLAFLETFGFCKKQKNVAQLVAIPDVVGTVSKRQDTSLL